MPHENDNSKQIDEVAKRVKAQGIPVNLIDLTEFKLSTDEASALRAAVRAKLLALAGSNDGELEPESDTLKEENETMNSILDVASINLTAHMVGREINGYQNIDDGKVKTRSFQLGTGHIELPRGARMAALTNVDRIFFLDPSYNIMY